MKKGATFPFSSRNILVFALIVALLSLSIASFSATSISASSRALTGTVGGCQMFPSNNIWNYPIAHLPVAARSVQYVANTGLDGHLHPDFGSGLYQGSPIGFPYTVVSANQSTVPVSFTYASESDPGPYPIPTSAPVEGGSQSTGDRHVLAVERGSCKLYEMFSAYPQKNGSWQAGSGAVWNLASNALRPARWTSADAAGLPILPGLVFYNEIESGVINHALRFTVAQTQEAFLWPARHFASSSHDLNLPPMGLRFRLKASVPISSFSRTNQIILTALKQYGMFVADNGTSWFLSGTSDSRWNNDDLHALTSIPGSDFEAVDESSLEMNANSGQVRGLPKPTPTPTHTRTASVSPTVIHTPTAAVEPTYAISSDTSSHSSNSTGNTLFYVLGGFALALMILGAIFLFRRKRRSRAKHSL